MAGGQRYSPDDAKRVLERAARIQAEDDGATGDVSSSDLLTAAEQAGISSTALRRAMAEERGELVAIERERKVDGGAVEVRLRLPHSVSEAAVERVWDVAIHDRRDLGEVELLGNTRVWRPKESGGFEVGVRRGDQTTDVWIRRRAGFGGAGWLPWLAVGAVAVWGMRGPTMLAFAIAAYFGTRFFMRWRRRQQAGEEVERVANAIEAELVRPDAVE